MEPVTVVVLDGEELPISICLTQHRLAHQLGSSLLLQEGPVLDPLMLAASHVIQLCSLLKVFNTLRSVEESLAIRRDLQLEAFVLENLNRSQTLDDIYGVDGVSLTYGNSQRHIWTFENALD